MTVHSSPLMSLMAASVDRERHREAEMRRRLRLAAPHEEHWTGPRRRSVVPGKLRSLGIMSSMSRVLRVLRVDQWRLTGEAATHQPGMEAG